MVINQGMERTHVTSTRRNQRKEKVKFAVKCHVTLSVKFCQFLLLGQMKPQKFLKFVFFFLVFKKASLYLNN